MRIVLQRVRSASVTVEDEEVSSIGPGLLLLVGVAEGDGEAHADWLAEKVAGLRIFNDEDGKMNLSALDTGGEVLAVSQFTLLADTRKGKRPSFIKAAAPEKAEPLFDYFCERLRAAGVEPVKTGRFGAMMDVALVNDGPVTIILER
ncbi:MAG TPA: D-aminoacyl-tRNA deacylase [Rubrobacteraceae bacterium]|nr:D-aminoacyl-tRNA deacylase [Rubrobacteraceae bacterium]